MRSLKFDVISHLYSDDITDLYSKVKHLDAGIDDENYFRSLVYLTWLKKFKLSEKTNFLTFKKDFEKTFIDVLHTKSIMLAFNILIILKQKSRENFILLDDFFEKVTYSNYFTRFKFSDYVTSSEKVKNILEVRTTENGDKKILNPALLHLNLLMSRYL